MTVKIALGYRGHKSDPHFCNRPENVCTSSNDSNLRRLTHSSRLKSATSWWYLRTTFSSLFSSECSLFFRWRVGGQPMMHATRRRLEKATFYAVTYVRQKGRTAVKVSSRVYLTFCVECNKALNAIVLLHFQLVYLQPMQQHLRFSSLVCGHMRAFPLTLSLTNCRWN